MRANEFIVEYRDRLLQYVKSLLPTWPDYVLKDWLVPNKGNFSNLPADALKNSVMEKVRGAGLTTNTKWQLIPNMKFTMDMFEPKTKQRLMGRAGGSSDLGMGIPKDKERHATQAALAQQQGGVRSEPVLLIKSANGYELLEGWHRTIQHFHKFPDGYTGPAYVAVAQGQQGVTEGATVTRIDSKPITDFGSSLKAYKHTDDWSQSGVDTGDDSYWKNKNLKTNTTKGLFAGDPKRTALYATGNAHETRYVEFTQNGQPIVYFDRKDLPAMRSRKTYLTVFDASDFRQLPTGEWFSENPSKPIKQVPIGDPFKYIADQGWIVRVTDDLDKVFKQVKNMHKAGKIAQYGAEGMNESKQGVAEGLFDRFKKKLTANIGGIDLTASKEGGRIIIDASSQGKKLGIVMFNVNGKTLVADRLMVQPEYRGQGIAEIMYDWAKGLGYTVQRSSDQTDDGKRFWDKLKGEETNVWEQDVAEST